MEHKDAPVVPEEVPNAFDFWSEAPPVVTSYEVTDKPTDPELSEDDNLGLEIYHGGPVSGPPRDEISWSGSLEPVDTPTPSGKKPRGKKAKKAARAIIRKAEHAKRKKEKAEPECVSIEVAFTPTKSDKAIGRKKKAFQSERNKAVKNVYRNKDKEISRNLRASRKDKVEVGRETRVKEVRAIKLTDVSANLAEITKTHAAKKLEKKKLKKKVTNADGTKKSTKNSWKNNNRQIPGKSYKQKMKEAEREKRRDTRLDLEVRLMRKKFLKSRKKERQAARAAESAGKDGPSLLEEKFPESEAIFESNAYSVLGTSGADVSRYPGMGLAYVASTLTAQLVNHEDPLQKRMFKAFNVCLALCTSTSVATDFAIFCLIDDLGDLVKDAWQSVVKIPHVDRFVSSLDIVETESSALLRDSDGGVASTPYADMFRVAFRNAKYLIEGEFFETLQALAFSIMNIFALEKSTVHKIRRTFGKPPKDLTILAAGDMLMSAVGKFIGYAELSLRGLSVTSVLLHQSPMWEMTRLHDQFKVQSTNLTYGLPVASCRPAREFLVDVESWLKDVTYSLEKCSPLSDDFSKLTEMKSWGNKCYCSVKTQLQSTRAVPFAIVITGKPGIGKSTILEMIYEIVNAVFGRDAFDHGMVYTRTPSSQFWERYDPLSMPFIHISEVGCVHKNITSTRGDPILAEVCSVVDSEPFPVDMAVAEDKGKNFVIPEFVVIDTNISTLGAENVNSNPSAVLRRFLFVEAEVRDEFAVNGRIDPSKTDEKNYYDKWRFGIYRMDPVSNTKSKRRNLLVNGNTVEFENVIRKECVTHFIQQGARSHRYVPSKDGEVLPVHVFSPEELKDFGADDDLPYINVNEAMHDLNGNDEDYDMVELKDMGYEPLPGDEDHKYAEHEAGEEDRVVKSNIEFITDMKRKHLDHRSSPVSVNDEKYSSIMNAVDANVKVTRWSRIKAHLFNKLPNCPERYTTLRDRFYSVPFYVYEGLACNATAAWDIITLFLVVPMFFVLSLVGKKVVRSVVNKGCLSLAIFFGMFLFFNPIGIYLALLFLSLWIFDLGSLFAGKAVGAVRQVINYKLQRAKNSLKVAYSHWTGDGFRLGIVVCGTISFILAMRKVFRMLASDIPETEGNAYSAPSNFPVENTETKRAQTWETSMNSGIPSYRVRNALNPNSFTVITEKNLGGVHNGSLSNLNNSLRFNIRPFKVLIESKNEYSKCYALGLRSNFFLVPRHAFGDQLVKGSTVILSKNTDINSTQYSKFVLQDKNHVHLAPDYVMIYCTESNCRDILKHFSDEIVPMQSADAMIEGDNVVASYLKDLVVHDVNLGNIKHKHVLTYDWNNHGKGKCGLPVLWKNAKNDCVVAGVHIAGIPGKSTAFCSYLTRSILNDAILMIDIPYMQCHSVSVLDEDISPPHFRSIVRYEEFDSPEYIGNVGTNKTFNQKSRLQHTDMHSTIRGQLDKVFGEQEYTSYSRPMMSAAKVGGKYINPYNVTFRKFAHNKEKLDLEVMKVSIEQICVNIGDSLDRVGVMNLQPYNIETALNGCFDDYYARAMDFSKAAGFGTPGKKRDYCVIGEDGKRYPNEVLLKEVNDLMDAYANRYTVSISYEANLKDEPRSSEKVKLGKTRVYYATPFAYYILMKCFLGPLMTEMAANSEAFHTTIGKDMHRQADEVYERVTKFSEEYLMEGDYGGYDTSMPVDIGLAASTIYTYLLEKYGYTEEQLVIVRGILTESIFVNVVINGDKFCVPGLQPSGKYGTAEDNSIRGLILLVYAWNCSPCRDMDFFEHNALITYGDDMGCGVSDRARSMGWNTKWYATFCEEVYGMTFTTAAKGAVEDDYVRASEFSFLKRNFKYSDVVGKIVAPLHMDSIARSCQWYSPSSAVSKHTQMEGIVQSALRELFFHATPEQYEEMADYYLQFFENNVEFPTYHDILESITCPIAMNVWEEEDSLLEEKSAAMSESGEEPRIFDPHSHGVGLRRPTTSYEWRSNSNLLNLILDELIELENEFKSTEDPFPGYSFRSLKKMPCVRNDPQLWNEVTTYYRLLNRKEALEATATRLQKAKMRSEIVFSEADMPEKEKSIIMSEADMGDGETTVMENVTDMTGESPLEEKGDEDLYFETGQHNFLRIEDYLARPLEVATISVAPGADLTFQTEIWDLFLDHPSIRAKIRNYAFIRGNMNVRIAVSGSPFHYSKFMVSYQPYAAYNETLKYHESQFVGTGRFQALSYLSQSPNVGYLDVGDNQPLDMEFPFICGQPMLRLYNDSPLIIPIGGSFQDAENLGKMYVMSINPVESASATPTSVSIFIYAWMTNVELGCPTGTVLTVETEADMGDERRTGPVEYYASKAAAGLDLMGQIPFLAPFTATASLVAKTAAGVASLFGFSKPSLISAPMRVKNQPFQNGAVTTGSDTTKKISLDPLQELPVDATVVATDLDDMALINIVRRESLFDTVSWLSTDTPLVTSIWIAPVTPCISKRRFIVGTTYDIQPTPMQYVANCFDYWRGDITYRLEIVASQYHRGKLAIYFEPNVPQSAVIDTDLDVNKQYMKIIDIQDVHDIEFTVQWAFPKAWAKTSTGRVDVDLGEIGFGTNDWFEEANGYLAIVPFTALQSPDGSDISINIYVKSDNMCFNRLRDIPSVIRPTTEADMPEQVILNPSSASMQHISEMHFGEMPLSFRALLKRYDYQTEPYAASGASTHNTILLRDDIYPAPRPNYSGGTGRFNLYYYLRYAYLGLRGGMKRRVGLIGDVSMSPLGYTTVTLMDENSTDLNTFSTQSDLFPTVPRTAGSVMYHTDTNGGVEFETPFYTNNLFLLSCSDELTPAAEPTFVSTFTDRYSVSWPVELTGLSSDVYLQIAYAAGDDFSFMRFQGGPVYRYSL